MSNDAKFAVPAGQRQLFVDDHGVAEVENLVRTLHQPSKKGAVIRPDFTRGRHNVQTRSAPHWNPPPAGLQDRGRGQVVRERRRPALGSCRRRAPARGNGAPGPRPLRSRRPRSGAPLQGRHLPRRQPGHGAQGPAFLGAGGPGGQAVAWEEVRALPRLPGLPRRDRMEPAGRRSLELRRVEPELRWPGPAVHPLLQENRHLRALPHDQHQPRLRKLERTGARHPDRRPGPGVGASAHRRVPAVGQRRLSQALSQHAGMALAERGHLQRRSPFATRASFWPCRPSTTPAANAGAATRCASP